MVAGHWNRLVGNRWVGKEPVVVAESVAGTDKATDVGLSLPRATQRSKLHGRTWLKELMNSLFFLAHYYSPRVVSMMRVLG